MTLRLADSVDRTMPRIVATRFAGENALGDSVGTDTVDTIIVAAREADEKLACRLIFVGPRDYGLASEFTRFANDESP